MKSFKSTLERLLIFKQLHSHKFYTFFIKKKYPNKRFNL